MLINMHRHAETFEVEVWIFTVLSIFQIRETTPCIKFIFKEVCCFA